MKKMDALLQDIHKIASVAEAHAWMTKFSKYLFWILIPLMIVALVGLAWEVMPKAQSAETPSWNLVQRYANLANHDRAADIAEQLVRIAPHCYFGQRRLAEAYLSAGRLDDARVHYAEAYRLLPTERHRELLQAVQNRMQEERSQPRAGADELSPATQP